MISNNQAKVVLVISVHPDDETLGCGGTLLKHKSDGDQINWLIITCPTTELGFSQERIDSRNKEIERVAEAYGFNQVLRLEIPTTTLDQVPSSYFVGQISEVFHQVEPQIIYLQHYGDAHSDHKYTFDAAYSCTKSFRYPFIKEVYTMETLSETEFSAPTVLNSFHPNTFIDISDFMEKKIEIMKIYESELKEHPFPRSIDSILSLGLLRGSQCNSKYAEAFCCLKLIK